MSDEPTQQHSDDVRIGAPAGRSPRRFGGLVRPAMAVLFVAIGCVSIVSIYQSRFQKMSPTDEITHFDYAERVSRFDLPRPGDYIGELAMRTQACRGIDRGDDVLPPCSSPDLRPTQFYNFGSSTTASGWPVYYFIAGVLGRTIHKVGLTNDLLAGTRIAQAFWMFLAWWGLFAVLRRLNVLKFFAAAIATAFVMSPQMLLSFSTVTPDATFIPAAAGLVLTAMCWVETRSRKFLALLAFVASFGLLCDRSNIMSVALVGVFLFFEGLSTRARHVVVVGIVAGCAGIAWLSVSRSVHETVIGDSTQPYIAASPQEVAGQHVATEFQFSQPTKTQLWENLTRFLTPIALPYVPTNFRTLASNVSIDLLNQLGIAAVGGLALVGVGRSGRRGRNLALASWLLMFTGPLVAWFLYQDLGTYFVVNSRFAIGLCVGVAAAIGVVTVHSKAAAYLVAAIAIGTSTAMFLNIVTASTLAI